jgi:hypothetical protein
VKEEMAAAVIGSPENAIAKPAPIDEQEMESLLDILLDPEHNKTELSAFLYAWKGAIAE